MALYRRLCRCGKIPEDSQFVPEIRRHLSRNQKENQTTSVPLTGHNSFYDSKIPHNCLQSRNLLYPCNPCSLYKLYFSPRPFSCFGIGRNETVPSKARIEPERKRDGSLARGSVSHDLLRPGSLVHQMEPPAVKISAHLGRMDAIFVVEYLSPVPDVRHHADRKWPCDSNAPVAAK